MIESIIVAVIVAAIVTIGNGYVQMRVLDVRVNGFKDRVIKLENEVSALRQMRHDWAPHIGWVDQQRRMGK